MTLIKWLRKLLEEQLLESVLSNTSPPTRLAISLLVCAVIFYSSYIILLIFTSALLLVVFSSPESLTKNLYVILFPVLILAIFSLLGLFNVGVDNYTFLLVSSWKLLILSLTAVLIDVLIPQRDMKYLVRYIPFPQVWGATIAGVRTVQIASWAFDTTYRTIRTRGIYLTHDPKAWADAVIVSFFGHLFQFAGNITTSMRSRGLESRKFTPYKKIPTFDAVDVVVLALFLLTLGSFFVIDSAVL